MKIQRCGPLDVREVYRLRPYRHIGTGVGIAAGFFFLLLFGINLTTPIGVLIAALVACGLGFGFYYYLESRLLVITCPHCGGDINTNTPWECGFKKCRNENVDQFPFVHECGNPECRYIPKAYICHHEKDGKPCGKPIFLTTDQQALHAARRLEFKEPPVKTVVIVKDVIGDKIATQKEEVRDLEHVLKKAEIEQQIKTVKRKPTVPPPLRSEDQIKVEMLRKAVASGQSIIDLKKKLDEEAHVKYAGDPEGLEEALKNNAEVIFAYKERTSGGF